LSEVHVTVALVLAPVSSRSASAVLLLAPEALFQLVFDTTPAASDAAIAVPRPTKLMLMPQAAPGAAVVKVREVDLRPLGSTTATDEVPEVLIKAAGTEAVSCVELPKVVGRGVPFQDTTSPETKLVPFAIRVKLGPPAWALDGDSELSTGAAGFVMKLAEFDVTPAGACTASAPPFHSTVFPETKLLPLTVNVNAGPPAGAFEGDSAVKMGTGGLIAKLRELDVAPTGVCTTIVAVPALAINTAGTAAVSWVELPNVVASAPPFHSTKSPETKLLPLTVSVNAEPPAFLLEGERELSVGTGGGAGAETVSVAVTTAGEPTEPSELIVTWPT
jgi:hypothetical protein